MKNVGLYVGRRCVKLYTSLAYARRGMQALYDNGKVEPGDEVYMLWHGFRYYH